jgi:hypothetical protein
MLEAAKWKVRGVLGYSAGQHQHAWSAGQLVPAESNTHQTVDWIHVSGPEGGQPCLGQRACAHDYTWQGDIMLPVLVLECSAVAADRCW